MSDGVKKFIMIFISILIVLGIGLWIINLVYGGEFLSNGLNAVGDYINNFFQKITGDSSLEIVPEVSGTIKETVGF
jgi:hypothetical protein